jgi:hypothetical protein
MPAKPKTKTTRKKTGPKPMIIGYDMVTRAASIQCTEYEIAKLVGLTDDGFRKRKARDKKLRDALEEGYSGGRRSLRRVQWEGAQKGNPTMMIWMGKQYLGQRDKAELKQDISVATDVRDMTDEQLEAIVRRGKK